ncbi:MAG: YraN family protein [Bacteroidales bacterium]|nr:YraN family protein [Bacteroidales bacterium]
MITKGKKALGALGEQVAADYLQRQGHTVLQRNWRGGHCEIDLITLDGSGVHFVEVKSRTAPVEAAPEENVRAPKQRNITTAALKYLHEAKLGGNREIFFDVVAVVFDGEKTEVKYFPQAWIPTYFKHTL